MRYKPQDTMDYKGYTAKLTADLDRKVMMGRVIGLRRSRITFEGASVVDLIVDFCRAVETYFAECREKGIRPEKPRKRRLKPDDQE